MAVVLTKQRRRSLGAAYKDSRIRPALTYANNVTPQDVGVSDEFGCCVVWLAFCLLSSSHSAGIGIVGYTDVVVVVVVVVGLVVVVVVVVVGLLYFL